MKQIYLVFILLAACNSIEENKIFIGGHIINPSSKHLTIYHGDKLIDSLILDKDNKFMYENDSMSSGIYKFEHPPKNQTIFVEPGDSMWFRVNTKDFDASISFSGKGAAKNNFLMDTYLELKNERSFLSSKYSENSKKFKYIIDSLMRLKNTKWKKFDSINILSDLAKKITKSSFVYSYANRLERYALIRGNKKHLDSDTINYFKFRKKLSLKEEELSLFEPYIKYIMSYSSNKSLDNNQYFITNKNKTNFNINRLKVIDMEITSFKLRSTLFRSIAYDELINFNNHKSHKEFIAFFSKLENGADQYIDELTSLYLAIENMQTGKKLPSIEIEDSNFRKFNSSSLYGNKNTVIYFWSQTQMNYFKNTYELVLNYRKKFPNYRFIGICLEPLNSLVIDFQKEMNIPTENQFAMVNFENGSKKWVLTMLNKGIIIDKNGLIKEGFGIFTSDKFEEILYNNYR